MLHAEEVRARTEQFLEALEAYVEAKIQDAINESDCYTGQAAWHAQCKLRDLFNGTHAEKEDE